MKAEWILVGSRDEARLFVRHGTGPLELLCDVGNPVGRLKAQDLESDAPGRSTDSRMRARHALSTEQSIRERALGDFYRDVIDRIERATFAHEYDSLTVIAEPRLLGIIRNLMPDSVRKTVAHEIPKDLSYEDESQLLHRIEHL